MSPAVPAPAPHGQGPSAGRRHPGHVTEIHHQARRSLWVAAAFTGAAPLTAVVPHSTGGWLPMHVFLVGGLLGAISGATPLLAVTWSAAPAPPRRVASIQRWALAAGAVAVALGRELDHRVVATGGGVAVAAALVLLGAILARVRAAAVADRFAPAIDTYLLALAAGVAGTALAVVLVAGGGGRQWGELRATHLTLNLYGLVGLVIVGTLPWFAATQARTRRSPRATAARMRALAATLAAATAVAAAGQLVDRPGIAGTGLAVYAAGIATLCLLLPVPGRRQVAWAGPRLVQLAAGLVWWVATTLLLAAAVAGERADQGPILRAMVIGGFAQILLASLAYLGPVVRGGGHVQLSAGFALTRSWPGLVAANVAAAGVLVDRPAVTAGALAWWTADTAVRAVRLARQRHRAGP